ncbi:uncharacterized transmembrane protein DDB_G0289901-like [Haliotis cracherodii]|uniref:uncharacterized transmembrane protein DDB_G0289901-like n=1 Tax=Haliotis cracherodii TaxID=6455 RepID=UPI0039ED535B
MVHQIVVALCVVIGLASQQVFAQWSGMDQSQGQGLGQGQMGELGTSAWGTNQGQGFRQGQDQLGGWNSGAWNMGQGQGFGQGLGQGQSQFGGWGGALGMGQGGGWGQASPAGLGMGGMGQGGGWGQASPAGLGMGGMFQQEPNQYQTCIAKNSNGDEMRVTFSSSNNNPWFGNQFGNALRLTARISSNQAATLQGQFQLVVTEFSRTEEVCSSRALGDILTDRTWWSQSRTPRGIVGTPVTINQGQTATSSETVENLAFEELTGRGLALCPSHQIFGSTCRDVIPLCCKIGFDSQPATTPFTAQNQLFGQGLLGMQNPGSNNGLGGGFGQRMPGGMGGVFNTDVGRTATIDGNMNTAGGLGLNQGPQAGMNQRLPSGMNGGMNQGLPSGMNGGMNQGLPSGMNGGMNQGLPSGMNGGMNQGLPSGMNGGMNQGLPTGMNGGMNQGLPSGMNGGMNQGLPSGMNGGMNQGLPSGMNGGMNQGLPSGMNGGMNQGPPSGLNGGF